MIHKTILIDFDGVIHSYASGWKGIDVISDPPIPGAIEFLQGLIDSEEFNPIIFTTRALDFETGDYSEVGIRAVQDYLIKHGLKGQIPVTYKKEPAELIIDDR